MTEYSDPEKNYSLEYPEGWLPLTHEGSPHVSLASLTTGGYLKIEAYEFDQPNADQMRPEKTLRSLTECDRRAWEQIGEPSIQRRSRDYMNYAFTTYTRVEPKDDAHATDFG